MWRWFFNVWYHVHCFTILRLTKPFGGFVWLSFSSDRCLRRMLDDFKMHIAGSSEISCGITLVCLWFYTLWKPLKSLLDAWADELLNVWVADWLTGFLLNILLCNCLHPSVLSAIFLRTHIHSSFHQSTHLFAVAMHQPICPYIHTFFYLSSMCPQFSYVGFCLFACSRAQSQIKPDLECTTD